MNVLVLGIGNLLLQDEGAGVQALEEFEKRYGIPEGVELLDGGTSGIELLHALGGRDALFILDVVKGGRPPGTIVRMEGEEVPAFFRERISPHQLGLSDLLAVARLTDRVPEKIVLLGIEPEDLGTGLELSGPVSRNLGKLVDLLASELASCNNAGNPSGLPEMQCRGGSGGRSILASKGGKAGEGGGDFQHFPELREGPPVPEALKKG